MKNPQDPQRSQGDSAVPFLLRFIEKIDLNKRKPGTYETEYSTGTAGREDDNDVDP